ncbi:MAG: rhodanese-like domain-containing protein [Desulfomonilaceae bacterium]
MLSPLAARKAEKLGYKNIKVYHAGLPDWRKAGHVVVSNNTAIEEYNKLDASYILIDTRPADQIAKGHIPKAVSLPKDGIDPLKDQFPNYKGAAIILYGDEGVSEESRKAFQAIAGWGYNQVSILDKGYKGWQSAGKTVATGVAATNINYIRKLLPGEIELSVFKGFLEKPSPDMIILDVRNVAEVNEGKLPNTVNIPLDELEVRISEVPKDKRIIVHCATGARAEMAYTILKNAGYNTGYLRATLSFDKDKEGSYILEE